MADFDGIIAGAPTWNTGADEMRSGTEWDDYLYDELPNQNLTGKPVAVFGLGDCVGYGENFCDAMEELASCFEKQGARIVGMVPTSSYDFEESKSVRGDKFVGLPIDEDNESDLTDERLSTWCEQVKQEMK
eukprot:CAMPEP_0198318228 /NCGR_PEP_ID=MMETSP1450-20131203/7592_1 /TAXON_ID=753684 ORGANISM="Madagascaria erythrocladiodes, Strain CCMP3234" /NCGR_SAMPLE_ID=MMETSP1450 /ASSEMBLY_ACC=CAM_ASM_001115 /LENGTH=130 /DNA_ID=CAMNT_0044021513 /DNA_START=257 /DNA_END=649 /DNA_ORIENTATION=+